MIFELQFTKQAALMTFKIVERLFTIIALIQCLAGGASEFTDEFGIG